MSLACPPRTQSGPIRLNDRNAEQQKEQDFWAWTKRADVAEKIWAHDISSQPWPLPLFHLIFRATWASVCSPRQRPSRRPDELAGVETFR
jgi:hypothetical protein